MSLTTYKDGSSVSIQQIEAGVIETKSPVRTSYAGCYHIDFSGVNDAVRVAARGATRTDLFKFRFFDAEWVGRGFVSFDEIVKAVDSTWSEGVDRIEELSREIEQCELPRPTVTKRRRVWDEYQGDEVDFDRWKVGEPHFRDTRKTLTHGPKLISIIVELGSRADQSSDELFWRGALAVSLARIVEDAGYRTEIIATTLGQSRTKNPAYPNILTTTNLKNPGEPIDIGSLANATSGWYHRTVSFASWLAPHQPLTGNLGYSCPLSESALKFVSVTGRPWIVGGVYTKNQAVDAAKRLLSELEH